MRILLVEDEPAIAQVVLHALRADGFEAVHCLTGGEALATARQRDFDLAILDVGLPDIGGFALCLSMVAAGVTPSPLDLPADSSLPVTEVVMAGVPKF